MATASITLISKPGCHLCDDARAVVTQVLSEVGARPEAPEISLEELSILENADLHERYAEEIPVVLINGRVHNYWRIDPTRLTTALLELS